MQISEPIEENLTWRQATEKESNAKVRYAKYHAKVLEETGKDISDYVSTTEVLSIFETPFNSGMVAHVVAEKSDIYDKKDILRMWKLKSEIGRMWGDTLHKSIELWIKYRELPKNGLLRHFIDQFHTMFPNTDTLVAEHRIVDHINGITGTIDLVEVLDEKKKICNVVDHKTNVDLKKKVTYFKGIFPVATKNVEFKIGLQLNLYRVMLENSGWTVNKLYINHQFDNELKLIEVPKDNEFITILLNKLNEKK
jgi:hypothetical protein